MFIVAQNSTTRKMTSIQHMLTHVFCCTCDIIDTYLEQLIDSIDEYIDPILTLDLLPVFPIEWRQSVVSHGIKSTCCTGPGAEAAAARSSKHGTQGRQGSPGTVSGPSKKPWEN